MVHRAAMRLKIAHGPPGCVRPPDEHPHVFAGREEFFAVGMPEQLAEGRKVRAFGASETLARFAVPHFQTTGAHGDGEAASIRMQHESRDTSGCGAVRQRLT